MAGIGNSSTPGMGDIIQLNVGGTRYADVMTSLRELEVKTVLFEIKGYVNVKRILTLIWRNQRYGTQSVSVNHALSYKAHHFELRLHILNLTTTIIASMGLSLFSSSASKCLTTGCHHNLQNPLNYHHNETYMYKQKKHPNRSNKFPRDSMVT